MGTEFERKALKKMDNIEKIVLELGTLNRNIEKLVRVLAKKG